MPVQPFTPGGVQQKQTELYALSNAALLTQANAIRSDIKTWLFSNFSLSAAQQTYINGMDAGFIQFAASQVGTAVENRLSITLTAPSPLPPPSISKFIHLVDSITYSYSQSAGASVSGSLDIQIVY